MRTIQIPASTPYNVLIGSGLLSRAGELCLDALGQRCRLCVVSDSNVAPLYMERLRGALTDVGFDTDVFVIPAGEASKSTAVLVELLEYLGEHRFTRSDAMIALGGGVVGDLCGFAAAVYLRGIRYVQIPTTLLAAVDSSVGGKTAVDLRAGKNLAGAFHQPSLVLCDPEALSTLRPEVFADGCAEVIKYGVICDRPFFDRLCETEISAWTEEVIAACVIHKSRLVAEDEFDRGSRQLLNLGHTAGHAVELCSDLTVSHGSAVAIGTVLVTRAAVRLGLCPEADLDRLTALLTRTGLPTECPYSAEALAKIATADKKRSGDTVTLVLPHGIGDCRLHRIPVSELAEFFRKGFPES